MCNILCIKSKSDTFSITFSIYIGDAIQFFSEFSFGISAESQTWSMDLLENFLMVICIINPIMSQHPKKAAFIISKMWRWPQQYYQYIFTQIRTVHRTIQFKITSKIVELICFRGITSIFVSPKPIHSSMSSIILKFFNI